MKFSKKSKLMIIPAMLASFSAMAFAPTQTEAWTDQTHMAIERAAGLMSYQNACSPDVAKTIMNVNKIRKNDGQAHFYDAAKAPTRADVDAQLQMLGMQRDECPDGYILGAIVNSVRKSKAWTEQGKFDDYNYAMLGHYIGDLVQPLHMSVYDDFNRKNHLAIDHILNHNEVKWDVDGVPLIAAEIKVDDSLRFKDEEELINHMVKLANESYDLGQKLRKENRLITHDEAISRVSKAATFFRACMRYCGKTVVTD